MIQTRMMLETRMPRRIIFFLQRSISCSLENRLLILASSSSFPVPQVLHSDSLNSLMPCLMSLPPRSHGGRLETPCAAVCGRWSSLLVQEGRHPPNPLIRKIPMLLKLELLIRNQPFCLSFVIIILDQFRNSQKVKRISVKNMKNINWLLLIAQMKRLDAMSTMQQKTGWFWNIALGKSGLTAKEGPQNNHF